MFAETLLTQPADQCTSQLHYERTQLVKLHSHTQIIMGKDTMPLSFASRCLDRNV
jgi:hypothetical protein